MERFIGNIDAKTDVKGRVFVPATFRKTLQSAGETSLILRMDVYKDCLVLHPKCQWENKLDQLRENLDEWDEEAQNTFRQFAYLVESVEMDASGRILIPKKYLQMANITNEVRFLGMGDCIELWNRGQLEKTLLSPEDFRANVRKFLTKSKNG
jgi:MraZ protein